MSFLKKTPAQAVNSKFSLELVPDPTMEFSDDQKLSQANMMSKIQNVSNGLFMANPAVSVNGEIKSGQTYGKSIKVSHLADAMEKHGLVMRVSISGEHIACAMATADQLMNNNVIESPSGSFTLGVRNGYIRDIDFA